MIFLRMQAQALLAQTPPSVVFGERPLKFEHLSVAQGLSQSGVSCIWLDRQGFMWFGTSDGLNKYDGYSFTVYKHEAADSTSLSVDWVLSIYEDRAGTLWIGTFSGGLNCFDPVTEQFTRFVHDANNPQSLSNNQVNAVCEDHTGALWGGHGSWTQSIRSRHQNLYPLLSGLAQFP